MTVLCLLCCMLITTGTKYRVDLKNYINSLSKSNFHTGLFAIKFIFQNFVLNSIAFDI